MARSSPAAFRINNDVDNFFLNLIYKLFELLVGVQTVAFERLNIRKPSWILCKFRNLRIMRSKESFDSRIKSDWIKDAFEHLGSCYDPIETGKAVVKRVQRERAFGVGPVALFVALVQIVAFQKQIKPRYKLLFCGPLLSERPDYSFSNFC